MTRTMRFCRALATITAGVVFCMVATVAARADKAPTDDDVPVFANLKPLAPENGDDTIRKLLKLRFNEALIILKVRQAEFDAGRVPGEALHRAVKVAIDTRLELTDKPAERFTLLHSALRTSKALEESAEARFKAGRISIADVAEARMVRLDIELRIEREKAKGEPKK